MFLMKKKDRTYLSGDGMGKGLKWTDQEGYLSKVFCLKPSTQVLEPIKPLQRIRTFNEQRSSAHSMNRMGSKVWDLL